MSTRHSNPHKTLSGCILSLKGETRRGIVFIEAQDREIKVSYDQLLSRALAYLGHFQAMGLRPGDELVLQLPSNEPFVYSFWACVLGGFIPVPLTPGYNPETIRKLLTVLGQLRRPHVATIRAAMDLVRPFLAHVNLPGAGSPSDRVVLVDEIDLDRPPGEIHEVCSDDTVFVQFSSGSTGDPKGVTLTHDNVLANIQAIVAGMEGRPGEDRSLSWMPLTHDMGLIGLHLIPLIYATDHYLMDARLFVKMPHLWLKKVSDYRIRMTASPNFGFKLFLKSFEPSMAQDWDLSCVRALFNGAEPISLSLCRKFHRALAPFGLSDRAIFPVYGLAEATLAVTFSQVDKPIRSLSLDRRSLSPGDTARSVPESHKDAATLVDLGSCIAGCEVRIVDQADFPLEPGRVGLVQIRGRNVTQGYYRNEEATRKAFTSDGWFNTGDLGIVHDSCLHFAGRMKDIIFVNGQNYYPNDLETVLEQQVEGISLGNIAVVGVFSATRMCDEVVAFIKHKGPLRDIVDLHGEMRRALVESMHIDLDALVPVERIPRTTSGKVMRFDLARMYDQGEFAGVVREIAKLRQSGKDPVAGSTAPTEKILLDIWTRISDLDVIASADSFFDLGISSLVLVQIHAELEKIWPGKLALSDLFAHPTITGLAAFIDGGFQRSGRIGLIRYTAFPSAGASQDTASGNDSVFSFDLSASQLTRLKSVAAAQTASLDELLVALLASVLSRLAQSPVVSLQTLLDKKGFVTPYTFSVSDDMALSSLLGLVREQRKGQAIDLSYVVPMVFNIPPDMASVLLCMETLRPDEKQLTEIYDIVVSCSLRPAGACFVCEYNERRLEAGAVGDLPALLSGALGQETR